MESSHEATPSAITSDHRALYGDEISKARALSADELNRQVINAAHRLSKRAEVAHEVVELVLRDLRNIGDTDGVQAVVSMLQDHALHTANEAFELAGAAAVLIERQEVAYG